MTAKIAINGYGTIGKRVALAVKAQKDMKVVGVVKTRPTFEAWTAVENGFKLYTPSKSVAAMEEAGLAVAGTQEELIEEADLVVDATPGKIGDEMAALYRSLGKKAIFQGGEEHELCGTSFNAYSNYSEALGKDLVRVVSCNTTGLARTLYPLWEAGYVRGVLATMVRRAADPGDSKKGPINAIEPSLKVPSHHGPDVQTVIPGLPISTVAVKVPTTLMHLHSVAVELKKNVKPETIIDRWSPLRRIMLIDGSKGLPSTAQVMEMARDMGRPFSDLWEIAVWRDGVHVKDGVLYYFQAVHQESDVIPENVDCIRAMLQMETDPQRSIDETDRRMGVGVRRR
ncbi:MAG: type II glyceraldehyde-3-phosphate dehydrogenase [Thermoplasmata archaeon]|nr:type II glyceraldehyde-3-phosphate dehydrogenase [Thermoplasmata archaeon]